MKVTDSAKAKSALTLLATVFFIEAGFMAFAWVVPQLLMRLSSSSFEVWFKAQSLVWLALTVALLLPVWTLAKTVKETELVWVVLGAGVVVLGLEMYFLVDSFSRELGERRAPQTVLNVLSILGGVTFSLGLCIVVGKLGKLVPFAAALGAFVALRSLTTLGLTLRLSDDHPPMWIYGLRTVLGLGISIGMGVLALNARKAVAGERNVLDDAAVQQPITEASGMGLVIGGVVLLVLGIGGSAISFNLASSSSGGGHYFIATGAIATGLVQLVRGLTRLGRGSG